MHWSEVSSFRPDILQLLFLCVLTAQNLMDLSVANHILEFNSLATAELYIVLAHFFRRYKMSLPEDFVPPRKVDVFTLEYEKPGIPINVSIRE